MLLTIQAVSHRCGLSTHVIRMWERRYEALTPTRTDSNRRMYCEDEISRLQMLRELTEQGHRIGSIARLEKDQLARLLEQMAARPSATATPPPIEDADAGLPATARRPEREAEFVTECMEATRTYDTARLRALLQQARVTFGQRCMIHRVICPLIHQVMVAWKSQVMKPSHEYIATSVIREVLMTSASAVPAAPSAPEVMISTPAGEVHELGALLLAASARDLGWRVTYLGLNLPTEEIVACAEARQARAVALSLMDPERSPHLEETLRQMCDRMPANMGLLVGGCCVAGIAGKMADTGILWAQDLCGLEQHLLKLSAEG